MKLSLKKLINETGLQSTTKVPSKGQDWSKEDIGIFDNLEQEAGEDVGVDGLKESSGYSLDKHLRIMGNSEFLMWIKKLSSYDPNFLKNLIRVSKEKSEASFWDDIDAFASYQRENLGVVDFEKILNRYIDHQITGKTIFEAKIPQDKIDEIVEQTALKYSGDSGAARTFQELIQVAKAAAQRFCEAREPEREVDVGVVVDRAVRQHIGI